MRLMFLLVGAALCLWAAFVNAGWVQFGNPGLLFPGGVAAGFLGLLPQPEDVGYRSYRRP